MFDFTLTLAGAGWADAYLREGEEEHVFTASWLHDGLREFVVTVNQLFKEARAECWWQQEPGELRWLFLRNGDELVVRAEFPPEEPENYNFEPEDDYVGTTSFRLFCSQVLEAYRKILEVWGEDGYASGKGWDYPYPSQELTELNHNLANL